MDGLPPNIVGEHVFPGPAVDNPVGDLLSAAPAVHDARAVVSAGIEEAVAAWILSCGVATFVTSARQLGPDTPAHDSPMIGL
jgi:hypothetical protein